MSNISQKNTASQAKKTLEAALSYLKMGYSVVPVKAGSKQPRIKWAEFQTRHASEAEIRDWYAKHPRDGIGIVTGKLSNLIVIDIDSEAGAEAIEQLIPDNLDIPSASTPRAGKHCYFKFVEGPNNKAGVLPGVDIRTEGGFIIAPPTIGQNGKAYRWNMSTAEVPPPDLPETILKAIASYRPTTTKTEPSKASSLTFEPGKRNDDLFTLTYHLAKGGMSKASMEEHLKLIIENVCKKDPEWEKNPVNQTELENILNSALDRAKRKTIEIPELIPEETRLIDKHPFPRWIMAGTLSGDFARLYSETFEAPEEFYYFSFLTCLGALMSDRVVFDSGDRQQTRFYTLLLGQSAVDRKSSAIKHTVAFLRSFYTTLEELPFLWGVGSGEGLVEFMATKENNNGRAGASGGSAGDGRGSTASLPRGAMGSIRAGISTAGRPRRYWRNRPPGRRRRNGPERRRSGRRQSWRPEGHGRP